jgi:hypothetical protein
LRATLAAASEARDRLGKLPSGAEVDGLRAVFSLALERPPHTTKPTSDIDADEDFSGDDDIELDVSELLEFTYVDLSALREAVARTLMSHSGVASLGQVITEHPLVDGLAELVGYLQVGAEDHAQITDEREQVFWDSDHGRRVADMPLLLFTDVSDSGSDRLDLTGRHNDE